MEGGGGRAGQQGLTGPPPPTSTVLHLAGVHWERAWVCQVPWRLDSEGLALEPEFLPETLRDITSYQKLGAGKRARGKPNTELLGMHLLGLEASGWERGWDCQVCQERGAKAGSREVTREVRPISRGQDNSAWAAPGRGNADPTFHKTGEIF